MAGLCSGEPLWDGNATDSYRKLSGVTSCLQDTVFVWVPCGLVLLGTPFYYAHLKQIRDKPISRNLLNVIKTTLAVCLSLLSLVRLFHDVGQHAKGLPVTPAQLAAAGILCVAMVNAACCVQFERRKGRRSSTFLALFWLVLCVGQLINLSLLTNTLEKLTLSIVQGITSLLVFIQTCLHLLLVDKLPKADRNKDMMKVCPDESANVLSKLLFTWMTQFIWYGYRNTIRYTDYWNLRGYLKASYLGQGLADSWTLQLNKHQSVRVRVQEEDHVSLMQLPPCEAEGEGDESTASSEAVQAPPSLLRAILRAFWGFYALGGLLALLNLVFVFLTPIIFRRVLQFTEDPGKPLWEGYALALCLFLNSVLNTLAQQHYDNISVLMALRMRTAMMALVYRKSLRLSPLARKDASVGEIVNLMSVDSHKYNELMRLMNMLLCFPIKIGVALYLLWDLLGPSCMTGLGVMLLTLPINLLAVRVNKQLQVKQMQCKDSRIKVTNEAITGIKVLKLYAWEPSFETKIMQVRNVEIGLLMKKAIVGAGLQFISSLMPFMIPAGSYAVYVLSSPEHRLTPEIAFVSLALFNILRIPLQQIPDIINNLVQTSVSHKRLLSFLLREEVDPKFVWKDTPSGVAVSVTNGTFGWDKGSPTLQNINLSVPTGSLVAILGPTGAGKSSLLSALTGEMIKQSGTVCVKGSVSYVPQQAWIQHASIKDNILFNKSRDEQLYQGVLRGCALLPDLDLLPAADDTVVGEKGITLSGGQKLRVSLARAAYHNNDVCLLDDPLSAVDAHVASSIFEHVIGPRGMLKDKTRLMVSHSLWWLPQADQVIVLCDGQIYESGSYEELMSSGGMLAELIRTYQAQEAGTGAGKQVLDTQVFDALKLKVLPSTSGHQLNLAEDEAVQEHPVESAASVMHGEHLALAQQRGPPQASGPSWASLDPISSQASENQDMGRSPDNVGNTVKLTQTIPGLSVDREGGTRARTNSEDARAKAAMVGEEVTQKGSVRMSVYRTYWKAVGVCAGLAVMMLSASVRAIDIAAAVWLSKWSDSPSPHVPGTASAVPVTAIPTAPYANHTDTDGPLLTPHGNVYYLVIYAIFGVAQALCNCFEYGLVLYVGLRTSSVQHRHLLSSILAAPMQFFERTPTGRLLNRFSSDVAALDTLLPSLWHQVLRMVCMVLGSVCVMAVVTPLVLFGWLALGGIYIFILKIYVTSQRQNKRISSVHRSPVYSHFSETLGGIGVIRAFSQQNMFQQHIETRLDAFNKCVFTMIESHRWLSVSVELVGAASVLIAAYLAIRARDGLSAGLVGLSLIYATSMTGVLNTLVRLVGSLETEIIAMERIKEYIDITPEAPRVIPESRPEPDWPSEGRIQIHDLTVRYRKDLDLVLHGITCSIAPGDKVGIVGRTGAGKSTLIMALFRILEVAGGHIQIDDVTISTIGLHDLRSRLTIIPQDPVLFSGTLRFNLDPFAQHSDASLWKAIEQAHLAPFVRSLPRRLDHECMEGGENLSVGQRQLVCLARALLRRSRVLILDEATAACDLETDDVIQATIRHEFQHCTVLTVAHRLHTIMDYDRLIVLEGGRIQEYDTPTNLLSMSDSIFYSMARDAGIIHQRQT